MTYSESAEGVIITFERARQEVLKHSHPIDSPEYQEFLEEFGGQTEIDAGDLLRWLGY